MTFIKNSYEPAKVLRKIPIEMEGTLLAGSVVDDLGVRSMGQKVDDYDFGDHSSFNFSWEE